MLFTTTFTAIVTMTQIGMAQLLLHEIMKGSKYNTELDFMT